MKSDRQGMLEVWTRQVLLPDASVFSRQWLQIAEGTAGVITADELLARYLAHIRRSTLGIIRPVINEEGVFFRFLVFDVSLLSFTPPAVYSDSRCCSITLCLSGGFLVQRGECDRGRFCLGAETDDEGLTVAVELSDYCPFLLGDRKPSRFRKLLYRLTQAYIHKVVTISYLGRIHRDLTGKKLPIKVKKAVSQGGEEI